MTYKKLFDPKPIGTTSRVDRNSSVAPFGDRRDGAVYVYTEKIVLAVNVALATGRLLLVRGPTGSGKSSLAYNVARCQGWRYYEEVISSRTQARDLQWTFDAVRRLSDAQANQLQTHLAAYVEPGVLWWAFDRASARRRGWPPEEADFLPAEDPRVGTDSERCVVLLDEMDKADPDVPNDLLVTLGSFQFVVREAGLLSEVRGQDGHGLRKSF